MFLEKDELYRIRASRTLNKKFLMFTIHSTDTWETLYMPAGSPQSKPKMFLPREKKHKYDVDHREGLFYIRTNKDAKNFRVVTAPEADPSLAKWKPFIAHRDNVLIENIELFEKYAVSMEKTNAVNQIAIYSFDEKSWHSIQFPEEVYSAAPSQNVDYKSQVLRYNYQSMITPSSVYDYDMKSRKAALLKRQEVLGGYDPALYESKRLWALARDGVKVPVSIVYRKGFKRDGSAPMLLYAYGSYGFGMAASFSSSRLTMLDRGLSFAIAHIRGGDEMGEKWHDDGMLMNKKNTFNDFVDCAAFLISDKWTNKNRLAIEGGSAGGLLMGAVVNQRPDLFRAVHTAVPIVDVMNTMMDASLPLTVGEYLEWGNPNDKAS